MIGSTTTSSFILRRLSRIFGSVIRFVCGQRLHGGVNSTSGSAAGTLSAIEHSVTSTTRFGLFLRTQSIICAVEPVKSDAAITSGGHSGCATICTDGSLARTMASSSPVKRSCTSHEPFQAMIFTLVWEATYFARYWSGTKITLSTPRLSTTCNAFDDVQVISLSAFTSAEVLA